MSVASSIYKHRLYYSIYATSSCQKMYQATPSSFPSNRLVFCAIVLAVECGAPPLIGNATHQGDATRRHGSQVAYTCPMGYGIGGREQSGVVTSCGADGHWSDITQPCLSGYTPSTCLIARSNQHDVILFLCVCKFSQKNCVTLVSI